MISEEVIHSLSDEARKIAKQVAEQIARTEQQIDAMQVSLSALRRAHSSLLTAGGAKARDQEKSVELAAQGSIPPKRKTYKRRTTSRSAKAREIIARSLEEAQKPLNRSELLERLNKAGIEMPGENPGVKVSKILWNARDRFKNVGPGYWFTDKPLPTK